MGKSYLLISTNEDWIEKQVVDLINQAGITVSNWQKATENPDIHIVSSKKRLGIDDVRSLIQELTHKPFQEQSVVAVLEHAHDMTIEAQNAFLKLLEEPPAFATIMITANNKDSFLPTILSRSFMIADTVTAAEANEEQQALIKSFITATVGERFLKIKEITKESSNVRDILDQFILYYRAHLLTQQVSKGRIYKVVRLLLRLRELVEKQVSPRFILEVMAIKLPQR